MNLYRSIHWPMATADLNAKIGSCNKNIERTIGVHGIGELNNSRERLANLCYESDLVIGESICQHKTIHKYK